MSARVDERGSLGSKIGARHLERLAVVYVRQSTAQQLLRHQESTRLQYNLTERATALGWPRERVLVIDDDLGRSGANAEGRPGFQRLVAEVGLDHVGLILGVEMSRLARSCRDWHHLLEVCALFGTLISDLDGVYDPAHFNDRLLLGLKGTMSEAELHVLKQRMDAGRWSKAQRGELHKHLPLGYVRRASGEVIRDPDEQARAVVETIFAQFEARGTVTGVLYYLVEHGLRLPVRASHGADKGELRWTRPTRATLQCLFTNPTYAGAYVYGRRPTDARAKKPGRPATGRKVAHLGDWPVCLRDRLPAYLTWEQFEANQKQLADNRNEVRGVARRGTLLLAGLVRCGRCGRRMVAQYTGGTGRYVCNQEMSSYAGTLCQSLSAPSVDRRLEALVLRALEPAALEVSLAVAADLDAERARLERHWQQRLERAQYEVDRSRRQYDAVEPENRLVARTLERHLETHLATQLALQEDYRRHHATQPATLSPAEREAVRRLATDIPALWRAPSTTVEQRKAIARQLVDEVRVTVEGNTERVALHVTWAGGHATDDAIVRPVRALTQLSYYPALQARARALRGERRSYADVATQLNAEGWRPAKRRVTFNAPMIADLLARERLEGPRRRAVRAEPQARKDEWTVRALADELDMSPVTLHRWVTKGWVTARKVASAHVVGQWLVWADARERARLRALRVTPRTRWARPPAA